MVKAVRIVPAGATPCANPALVIAATAARQASSATARLAARLATHGAPAGTSAAASGGSFHAGVARDGTRDASTFVKPAFTVAF